MRKIDAFAHILPRPYLDRLERQLEKTMAPSQLNYYREGVFTFDPVLTDLDARWRKIEPYGEYTQILVLAVPRGSASTCPAWPGARRPALRSGLEGYAGQGARLSRRRRQSLRAHRL